MIAAALLVVLGAATLMQVAGLSMAMGAFIAGVMLAESSYRHELEADIEPFRGILLGLFFMAVGLSLDLDVIIENWTTILLAVPVLMAVKVATTYAVGRLFSCRHDDAVRVAFLLPQGGEFAFVLFSAAAVAAIFSRETASILIAIVTVSMALMPLFVARFEGVPCAGPAGGNGRGFRRRGRRRADDRILALRADRGTDPAFRRFGRYDHRQFGRARARRRKIRLSHLFRGRYPQGRAGGGRHPAGQRWLPSAPTSARSPTRSSN